MKYMAEEEKPGKKQEEQKPFSNRKLLLKGQRLCDWLRLKFVIMWLITIKIFQSIYSSVCSSLV